MPTVRREVSPATATRPTRPEPAASPEIVEDSATSQPADAEPTTTRTTVADSAATQPIALESATTRAFTSEPAVSQPTVSKEVDTRTSAFQPTTSRQDPTEAKTSQPSISKLDAWVANRIGGDGRGPLSRSDLEGWQLSRLRETLERARARSVHYARSLEGVALPETLADLERLPFVTEQDLREHGQELLCVSQDEVARIITLASSGTTGQPKRLFFSQADLEATIDFFHHGMGDLVEPGQTTLVLLPGETPDSTGDLLRRGLERMDVRAVIHGLAPDPRAALDQAMAEGADCLVGFPVHILAMARLAELEGRDYAPASVLLCSDYIPRSLTRELERLWGCRAHAHWGTVETGLGGAVECAALAGAHPREADLLLEIIDPKDGRALPPGAWGEIVVTTLTREAMPLIRYRSGDLGRLLPGACPCGGALSRLDRVQGRLANRADLGQGRTLSLADLDEILFGLPEVMDFSASLSRQGGDDILRVSLAARPGRERQACAAARERLLGALGVQPRRLDAPNLGLVVTAEPWTRTGISRGKRLLEDTRAS